MKKKWGEKNSANPRLKRTFFLIFFFRIFKDFFPSEGKKKLYSTHTRDNNNVLHTMSSETSPLLSNNYDSDTNAETHHLDPCSGDSIPVEEKKHITYDSPPPNTSVVKKKTSSFFLMSTEREKKSSHTTAFSLYYYYYFSVSRVSAF